MKKIYSGILMLLHVGFLFAQGTGPAGVGTSSDNLLWLKADAQVYNDGGVTLATSGQSVQQWNDQSGNGNNASQAFASNQPTYQTAVINGNPVVRFDGSTQYLTGTLSSLSAPFTLIVVTSFDNSSQGSNDNDFVFNLGSGSGSNTNASISRGAGGTAIADLYYSWDGANTQSGPSLTGQAFTVLTASHNSSSTFHSFSNNSSNGSVSQYSGSLTTNGSFTLGALPSPLLHHLDGDIAEMIVYNTIDTAEQAIIENYLSAKYNISIATGKDLFAHDLTYHYDLAGIGRYSSSHQSSDAKGSGIVRIYNPSSLGNGDFLLFGHNNGSATGTTSGIPTAYSSQGKIMQRTWQVDHTNDVGSVSVDFDLSGGGFGDPNSYELLIDADADFTNASRHTTGRSYDSGTHTLTFTGVNLTDDYFFTLANNSDTLTSTSTGSFTNASTWDCNCTPQLNHVIVIGASTNVTISVSDTLTQLIINNSGTLTLDGSTTLSVTGNLENSGTLSTGVATVQAIGNTAQDFTNSSLATLEFYNLRLNNSSGLTLSENNISVTNLLQVDAGTISAATNVTLVANSSSSAVVGVVGNTGAFSGSTWIVERYIDNRDAYWANLACPLDGEDMAGWDDDLFISGIGGINGNATGSLSNSAVYYTEPTSLYNNITSTTYSLVPGAGIEIFLGDTPDTLNALTMESEGMMNFGDEVISLTNAGSGWNLIGNPYAAPLYWDSLSANGTNVFSSFYVATPDGNYTAYGNGNLIYPHQGFWVWCDPSSSSPTLTIRERYKSNSTTNSFYKAGNKSHNELLIKLQKPDSPFSCETSIGFKNDALEVLEPLDVQFKKSPLPGAPALYTLSAEGTALYSNSLPRGAANQQVPLRVEVPEAGDYMLSFEGFKELFDYTCILLEDHKNGLFIDLSTEPSHVLRILEVGKPLDLTLHFGQDGTNICEQANYDSNEEVRVGRESNNTLALYFDYPQSTSVTVEVCDLLGNRVVTEPPFQIKDGRKTIDVPGVATGMFVVIVDNGKQKIVKKVVL